MKTRVQALPNFETLVDAYYPPLFKFAMSLCGDLGAALNLTQRTFLKALHRPEVLGEKRKIGPWLFTILFSEFLKRPGASHVRREGGLTKLTQTPLNCHGALQPSAT